MSFISIILISIGLAMDAFAVSITEGLTIKILKKRHIFKVAIIFGLFQAIMPFIGYEIGYFFKEYTKNYENIIAFFLLFFVGLKMIYDGYKEKEIEEEILTSDQENNFENSTNISKSNLYILGLATSIDALVVGFTFTLYSFKNLIINISIIGFITFIISSLGVYSGYKIGNLIDYKTEYIGGTVIILIALKNLFVLLT